MHSIVFVLLNIIRIAVLLIVTLAYAIFDVFNKRNVPNIFVYATVAVGILLTFTYPLHTIELSTLIAIAVAALGYVTYRIGILGAGDVYEFVFISLVIPLQVTPILMAVQQFPTPFILSVFIATGYATILLTPAYYITKARKKIGKIKLDRKGIAPAAALMAAYLVLIAVLNYISGNVFLISIVMLLVAIPSTVIILFRSMIYEGMVVSTYPSQLEEGDMIAVNMMAKRDLEYFRKRTRRFNRLATRSLIADTRKIRKKIPVYKNAIPLALFAFIGVVVSLLIGNIVMLLLA